MSKKVPRTSLGISERSGAVMCYMEEFLHQICAGPDPPSVCTAGRVLTGSRRDQGSAMAFPQLPGSFLNARLGAILEQNQPDLPVERVKI